MDDTIECSVERQFPELTGRYHLSRYAVDIEVLTPNGEADPDLSVLSGVPLP